MLEDISDRRAASDWRPAARDHHTWLDYRRVYTVTNLCHLFFSIQVSSYDVVGLDEGVQFPLQVLVLLRQQERVLLESLVLGFEVKVSVHECLVGVVHSF